MNKTLVILTLLFIVFGCKQYHIDRAHIAESDLDYDEAIVQYEKLSSKQMDYNTYKSLAELYLKRGDYEKALFIYDSLIVKDDYPKDELLAYAELLMANENYPKAKLWVDRYLQEEKSDKKALELKKVILNQGSFLIDTNQYTLDLIEIPATPQAYGAIPYKNGIIYTGRANKNEKGIDINPWDGWPYSRIYFTVQVDSGWSAPYDLSHSLNEDYNIGPLQTIPGSDQSVFILSKSYLSNFKTARKSSNKTDVLQKAENNIQLYMVEINNMKLDTPEVLPFCNPAYNYAQASLSPDGNMMIFSSDLPGGKGGSDLYISILNDSKWSDPVNLGSNLNTDKNESFPYLISEDTLYFSSEGHNSYGGLDIFYSTFDGTKWTKPYNLLSPINSYKDDFGISFNSDKKSGFISSNRSDLDRIYSFTMNKPSFKIEGKVVNKETQKAMKSIKITMTERGSTSDTIVYSDSEGKFNFPISSNTKYRLMAEENGYFTLSYTISTRGRSHSKVFHVVFEMEKIVLNKAIVIENSGDELILDNENARIKNIYYDFDKWDLRNEAILELDRLVWLFNDNPSLIIEISSHTDSRGSDEYNMKLSQKRANAVVEYLIDRGVNPKMMIAKGYGESKLVNKCANGVVCSEKEHQENRRSEFKVIGFRD